MKEHIGLSPKLAIMLAAPHTWVASVYPAIFGILFSLIHGYRISLIQSFAVVFTCVFLQASVNTLNDYYDYIKGTDSADDNVEKTDSVLVYNNVNPKSVLILGIIYLLIGVIWGIAICLDTGIVPLMIGMTGIFIIVLYSSGPFPISYLPIGELTAGLVMGLLIPLGVIATIDGQFHFEITLYSLPFVIGIGLIMMSNNSCDIEKDIIAGRKTLPILIGRKNTILLFKFTTLIWLLLIIVLSLTMLGNIGLLTIPLLILSYKTIIFIIQSKLEPNIRIKQMKQIVKLNILANGAYLSVIILKLIMEIKYV